MYNNFKICAFALCAISLPLLSSCSDDDNDGPKGMVKVGEITFENTNIILAGPMAQTSMQTTLAAIGSPPAPSHSTRVPMLSLSDSIPKVTFIPT